MNGRTLIPYQGRIYITREGIKVEANLKEKTGDPEASLNYMYAMPSFEKKPVIEATYRNKKKDGTFNKKESTISIAYPFCPFCGKKFSEGK